MLSDVGFLSLSSTNGLLPSINLFLMFASSISLFMDKFPGIIILALLSKSVVFTKPRFTLFSFSFIILSSTHPVLGGELVL